MLGTKFGQSLKKFCKYLHLEEVGTALVREDLHISKTKWTKSSLDSHVRKAGRKEGWRTGPSLDGT